MTVPRVGYVGLDHVHRDAYFQIIDRLNVELTALCEPYDDTNADDLRVPESRFDTLAVDFDLEQLLTGTKTHESVDALLESGSVDIVWVTLANRDMPAVVEKAIDTGVHVFAEKPIARTAAELRPTLERARASDVTVGTFFYYRNHPVSKKLRQLVDADFFGDLMAIDAHQYATGLTKRDRSHYLYDREASQGGVIQWIGVHWLDLLLYILDDPITRVSATLSSHSESVDVEDGATVSFETASGAIGSFATGYYLEEGSMRADLSVHGESGRASAVVRDGPFVTEEPVKLDLHSTSAEWSGAPHRTIGFDLDHSERPFGAFGLDFFQQFVEACTGEGSPVATIEDAYVALKVIDAIYEAAEQGGWRRVQS